jgi:hypothetical protein
VANKGALIIRFMGDDRDLNRTTSRVSKKMQALKTVGKGLAIGAGAVIAGVGAVGAQAYKDLVRVERLGAQTNAVIKATNKAAGRTKAQIDAQANSLEKLTGVEAEAVTEGQNMLLTFKNIKGKQFDQATKAVLDMGVAMNKGSLEGLDLSKTSIQVGKALNDPIKGISALSKVGVSFTQQQKDQIKAMVEAGDVAGAQKVILKELKGEFGGAAKAAGQTTEGMIAKIQNAWGNIAEETFKFLLPAIAAVGDWIQQKALPKLEKFGSWLQNDGVTYLRAFGQAIGNAASWIKNDFIPPFITVGKWVRRNKDWLGALGVTVGIFVGVIGAYKVAMIAWSAATKAAAAAQLFLTGAFHAFKVALATNPIGLIILAVAALAAGLVYFFTQTKTGQKVVKAVWSGIKSAIGSVVDWWTGTAWPNLKKGVSAVGRGFRAFGRGVKNVWSSVSGAIGSAWSWINRRVFRPIRIGIAAVGLGFRIYGRAIRLSFRLMGEALGNVWSFIKRRVFNPIRTFITVHIPAGFRNARDKVSNFFGAMRDRLASVGFWVRRNVFGKMRDALGRMRDAFRVARDKIADVWNGIKRAAARPVNFMIKWVWNRGLRKVLNAIPGVNLPEVKPIKFAKGGHRGGGAVTGGIAGRDSVPALYMPGEHVWTREEVRKVGGQRVMYGMRRAARAGTLEFAKGGELSASAINRAQNFARKQAGKPYGWGAVGPSSYDCSGFMSAITNVLQGLSPHRRRGATADFPWPGFVAGPGQFTIGSTRNYGGSGIGHMVGNLAGLGVESRGGRGVILGTGAMRTSKFPQVYHLGKAGASGDNPWFSTISDLLSAMRKLPGQIREIMDSGSWISGFLRKLASGLWSNIATYINKKVPDVFGMKTNPIPTKFAKGGMVMPSAGGTHIIAGEAGYREAIVPLDGPNAARLGGGGGTTVIDVTVEIGGKAVGRALIDPLRGEIRNRGGDVQLVLGKGKKGGR